MMSTGVPAKAGSLVRGDHGGCGHDEHSNNGHSDGHGHGHGGRGSAIGSHRTSFPDAKARTLQQSIEWFNAHERINQCGNTQFNKGCNGSRRGVVYIVNK